MERASCERTSRPPEGEHDVCAEPQTFAPEHLLHPFDVLSRATFKLKVPDLKRNDFERSDIPGLRSISAKYISTRSPRYSS
jgi:hypothetical protein